MLNTFEVTRKTGTGSLTLRGYLEGPADGVPQKDALVILCHGLMMRCDIHPVIYMAYALNQAGYTTLRFDFSGTGISDGDMLHMTTSGESSDLIAVVQKCRELFSFSRYFVLGHSLGGVVTAITAGDNPGLIDAIALLAPAGSVQDDCNSGKIGYENFDPSEVPDSVELWDSVIGKDYILDGQTLDIYERASKYTGPACIIHGDEDVLIDHEYGRRFHEVIKGSQFHLLRNGDHHFIRTKKLASEIVISFFDSNLNK